MPLQFISNYTPSLMPPDALEAIFVQRQKLAERLVELIRDSALTGAKHHTLLVGPRGIGKTHLVALTYHRIRSEQRLASSLKIAWLREEEWGVTSFLDLVLRILRALAAVDENTVAFERVEQLYNLKPEAAERAAANLLLELLGGKTLLLIVENLDDLFNGLADKGQKRFRAFLQEHPVCAILATSQSLFSGVSRRTSPFYGFLRIQHLEPLELTDVINLLVKIARTKGDKELEAFIKSPSGRARIRAVHHLAGGNHRVYMIFSQFLTRASLDQLVQPFMSMLDELTPYYQSRMMWLSPQQRKIVEFLADRRGAVAVKEIAHKGFMTHATASSQLKDLREKGYVVASAIGRDSFYELREPLMRLCLEVKKHRGQPIRIFVEFLRLWYSPEELKRRLIALAPEFHLEREYLVRTLEDIEKDPSDPRVTACTTEFHALIKAQRFEEAVEAARDLLAVSQTAATWGALAMALAMADQFDEALEAAAQSEKLQADVPYATRFAQLVSFVAQGRRDEALGILEKLPFDVTPVVRRKLLWIKASVLLKLKDYEQGLPAVREAIALGETDSISYELEGQLLFRLERFEEALEAFELAMQRGSTTWQVLTGRCVTLMALRQWDEAIAAADRATKFHPASALPWQIKAIALYTIGSLDDANEAVSQALARDPQDADMYEVRGSVQLRQHGYSEALCSFERAIELDPQSLVAELGHVEATLVVEWPLGLAKLESTLAKIDGHEKLVSEHVQSILQRAVAADPNTWSSRFSDLVTAFSRTKRMSVLADAIVETASACLQHPSADTWVRAWKTVGNQFEELNFARKLLEGAIRFRKSRDQRIPLEFAPEERKLLFAAAGIEAIPAQNGAPAQRKTGSDAVSMQTLDDAPL